MAFVYLPFGVSIWIYHQMLIDGKILQLTIPFFQLLQTYS